MGDQWYYNRSGKQLGPVSSTELRRLADSGQLSPYDLVWKEGMRAWVAASSLKGLFPPHPAPLPLSAISSAEQNVLRDDWGYSVPRKRTNVIVDFLVFRRMITPIFIQIFFWLGAIGCFILGMYWFFDGLTPRERSGLRILFGDPVRMESDFPQAVGGLMLMLVGPVVVRIYCELLILFFRMNQTLTEIKGNTERPR